MRSLSGRPIHLLMTLGCLVPGLHAQIDPRDLFDPAGSAVALDLAKTPLWLTVLQQASLAIKDKTVEGQFTSQFNSLRSGIETAIAGKNIGYLVKVEIFADEFGATVIPEGQIVFTIGAGTEPTDALAEFIRVPRVQGAPPSGLRDMSYYIWVKNRDGALRAGIIPREARQVLEGAARNEARRRNLLGEWERAITPEGLRSIQRDQYWSDVADKYAKLLNSEDHRRRAEDLRQEFNRAEAKFNDAYRQYQLTAEELSRQQNFASVLHTIGSITSVVDNAIKLGALTSSSPAQGPVKDSGKAQPPLTGTLEYTRTRTDALTGFRDEQRIRLDIQGHELQGLDQSLRDLFRQDKVNIPKAEEVLSIPRL